MTRSMRSLLTILLFVVTAASAAIPLTPVRAAGDDAPPTTADDNLAIAVNTTDGTVVFDVSFSLRRDADGVVDETNVAAALASCTGCTTVAFAFQAVLVTRNANVVIPQNVAIAFNDQCTECFTYASASQVVLGFSGPVRITHDGRMRLHDLRQALGELEARAAELAPGQFLAAAEAIERELISIMSEEVVRVGRRPSPRDVADQATTTSIPAALPATTSPATIAAAPSTPTEQASTATSEPAPASTPPSTPETTPTTATPEVTEPPVDPVEPGTTEAASDPSPADPAATDTTPTSAPDPAATVSP